MILMLGLMGGAARAAETLTCDPGCESEQTRRGAHRAPAEAQPERAFDDHPCGGIACQPSRAKRTEADTTQVVPASDYVRLHVVAENDTAPAQALKLEIRDAVLKEARALLWDCPNADAAWARVNAKLDRFSEAASSRAAELGYAGSVRCETGVFAFPDREYGAVTVPAGDYRALRVVIGAGNGHNWWCVLYPSLCWPEDVPQDAPFYSAIWNWLVEWFGGEAS